MLYISKDDFYQKAKTAVHLTREQEKACALAMSNGDIAARQKIIESYLPQVAAAIRKSPEHIQTLNTVYNALATLEQGVDSFNFLQDSESFSHHLSWRLRQCIVRCIADQR
jgi:DNA-directed RNA polymerase sigma subunit (sigma70/sigma32)